MPDPLSRRGMLLAGGAGAFGLWSWAAAARARALRAGPGLRLPRRSGVKPRNILVVLTDDHRYDALGFLQSQAIGETPTLDRLAREGTHFRNALVTTSLCSRACRRSSPASTRTSIASSTTNTPCRPASSPTRNTCRRRGTRRR